jgi:LmbE family N-acetylglucosaminyl deacetylase
MAFVDRLRFRRRKATTSQEELGKDGPMTGMVIVAHPDDAEFMCGGTVAKWCAQGWTVYYVLATSGDKGTHDSGLSGQDLAAIREQEQRDACKALGVKEVIFLGMPDGFLEPGAELRGEIVKLLRKYRPDVVITWDGFRKGFNHSDHRAVGIATRDAIYPAVRDHLYYPEHAASGLEAHQVNEMLLAGTDEPDYDVDIAAHLETKLQAVLCHKSQLGERTREEIEKTWRERMQSARSGQMKESFKRVTIRRSARTVQPKGTGSNGQQPHATAASAPQSQAAQTPR